MQRILITIALMLTTSALAVTPKQVPFGPGEQSLYEVSFLGVPAGIAQVTVGLRTEQYGAKVLPLVCVGQTTAALSDVFQIKDRFVSYFESKALFLPLWMPSVLSAALTVVTRSAVASPALPKIAPVFVED